MHWSKTIRFSVTSNEQTLAALSRTANWTHSICQQMCLCSVCLYFVNLEVTAVDSEMDVQRRWLCALVTSCNDMRHYVDVIFLR
jgi:hypothetical protein